MNNEKKLNNEIYKAPVIRRLLAFLTDIFLLLLLFLSFNQFVYTPVFENNSTLNQNVELYRNRLKDSNLYTTDNTTSVPFKITDLKNKMNKNDYIDKLDDSIELFYTNFSNEYIKIELYNNSKIDSNLFTINNGEFLRKDIISNDTYISFFESEYDKAVNLMNKYDDVVLNNASIINKYFVTIISLSLLTSILILYLIFPLIFKDGETIGKKLLGIGVVSLKDGFRIKVSQKIIRFMSFLIFEVILSVLLVGIPLIVSFSMMFFSKNNMTIHDQLAATICVDKKVSLIYKDFDEFIKHEEILLKN